MFPFADKVGIHRQVFNRETVNLPNGDPVTDNYLGRLVFLFEGDQVCWHAYLCAYMHICMCIV